MTTALYDALRELRHALLVAFVGLFGAGYLDQEANKRVIGAAREAEAVVSVGEGGDVLGEVDAVGDVLAVEALVFEGPSVGRSIPQKPLRFQGVFAPIFEIPRSWGL